MQPFETWLKADLQAPVTVKRIDGNLFSGDNQGNLVGVTVTDAGEPATLSGEVRGYFIRSDGNTVIMSGTIDGNKVTVVLPSACYTVVGQFSLVIKVGQVAVGACTGYVYQSNTDSTVDPEHVIPDIDQLLARVEALEGRATTLEGDVSAQNDTINAIEDGLAIIANGDVHPAIAAGQAVYVKNHSSLANGLYWASAAIGTNATLSTSNLTADASGGFNKLKGDIDSLNSNLTPIVLSNAFNIGSHNLTMNHPRNVTISYFTSIDSSWAGSGSGYITRISTNLYDLTAISLVYGKWTIRTARIDTSNNTVTSKNEMPLNIRKVENVVINFTDGIGYYDITSLGLNNTPLFSVVANNTDTNIGVIINTDIANSTNTSLKMMGKSVNVSGGVSKLSGNVRLIVTVYGN